MTFDEVSDVCEEIAQRRDNAAATRVRAAAADARRYWTHERYSGVAIETARRVAAEVALLAEGCLHFLCRAPYGAAMFGSLAGEAA
jgi:hypothetical protein